MNSRYWVRTSAKVGLSLFCAGGFYAVWLAAFLVVAKTGSHVVQAVAWVSAPVVTAAGFSAGTAALGWLTGSGKHRFLDTFPWTLIGCTFGAVAVVWFGAMLIVFGMFAVGTASVALREVLLVGASEDRT